MEIRLLKSKLLKYLKDYRDCFGRSDTRGHLTTYVNGQLSQLNRKSVEPIALAAGVPPRTLQQFLNSLEWDQEQLIDILQYRVARDHTSERSIGLIDSTKFGRSSLLTIAPAQALDAVVTDDGLDDVTANEFRAAGVQLEIVTT